MKLFIAFSNDMSFELCKGATSVFLEFEAMNLVVVFFSLLSHNVILIISPVFIERIIFYVIYGTSLDTFQTVDSCDCLEQVFWSDRCQTYCCWANNSNFESELNLFIFRRENKIKKVPNFINKILTFESFPFLKIAY